jgi:predicted SAM-dependent methyltransferase
LSGYVHVDSRAEVHPDVVADIQHLDKFPDGSADIIYCAHVLEHIPRPHILDVLEEWRRVLKPGGTLRLSVPDFFVLADLYLNEGVSMWRITGPLHGRQDYEANTHYITFDYEYLAWLLGTAGYHDIRRWQPAQVHPAGYDDISLARIDGRYISLNLEATAG